jgi:hypothetical protein
LLRGTIYAADLVLRGAASRGTGDRGGKSRDRFSPAVDPLWGEQLDGDDLSFTSYSFDCPPEHLDAIYDTSRFPLGS